MWGCLQLPMARLPEPTALFPRLAAQGSARAQWVTRRLPLGSARPGPSPGSSRSFGRMQILKGHRPWLVLSSGCPQLLAPGPSGLGFLVQTSQEESVLAGQTSGLMRHDERNEYPSLWPHSTVGQGCVT